MGSVPTNWAYELVNALVNHVKYIFSHAVAVENLLTLAIDNLALAVHNIVKLKHVFAYAEVAAFNLALRVFNGICQHLVLDRLVVLNAERLHKVLNAFAAEQAHKIVFKRNVKPRFARVALTAGAAAQLIVDTA